MIRLNAENHNSPEVFDTKFNGTFALTDMERLTKLAQYFTGGSYLDVGCLDSPMPALLAERYPTSTIWGLDFSHEVISFLAPRFPKVHYIEGDALRLPFEDESMDYVVAAEIMEHMDDPQALIDECMRVVKPGGWLAVSTPHIEAEKKHKIGGHLHVWSFDEADLHTLFPSPAVEVLTEGNNLTWLIWQQK